jgi:hypothetical protein
VSALGALPNVLLIIGKQGLDPDDPHRCAAGGTGRTFRFDPWRIQKWRAQHRVSARKNGTVSDRPGGGADHAAEILRSERRALISEHVQCLMAADNKNRALPVWSQYR